MESLLTELLTDLGRVCRYYDFLTLLMCKKEWYETREKILRDVISHSKNVINMPNLDVFDKFYFQRTRIQSWTHYAILMNLTRTHPLLDPNLWEWNKNYNQVIVSSHADSEETLIAITVEGCWDFAIFKPEKRYIVVYDDYSGPTTYDEQYDVAEDAIAKAKLLSEGEGFLKEEIEDEDFCVTSCVVDLNSFGALMRKDGIGSLFRCTNNIDFVEWHRTNM